MIRRLLLSPLSKVLVQLAEPRTFDFGFLKSTDRIGILNTLSHYSMYFSEPEFPNKLIIYPVWKSQTRTLEEWNASLPKRKKPIQPPKTNKKAYWEYQYYFGFYSYERGNYKRDQIRALYNRKVSRDWRDR